MDVPTDLLLWHPRPSSFLRRGALVAVIWQRQCMEKRSCLATRVPGLVGPPLNTATADHWTRGESNRQTISFLLFCFFENLACRGIQLGIEA
jgi:hypothetical protein